MQREVPVPVLSDPPLHLQTSPQNEFLKDSLRRNFWQFLIVYPIKHLHAVKKNELIKIDGQRLSVYIIIVFLILLRFIL